MGVLAEETGFDTKKASPRGALLNIEITMDGDEEKKELDELEEPDEAALLADEESEDMSY